MPYLFTSESVSEGHPDKVADQISDAILDEYIKRDPNSKVACETLVTTNKVIVSGEVCSLAANKDNQEYLTKEAIENLIREVISDIGYTNENIDFSAKKCIIEIHLHEQSDDINRGVETGGAGDQGMMFGYAVNHTNNLMPIPLNIAHKLMEVLAKVRKEGKKMLYLRPDSKSQVTIEYNDDNTPKAIKTIVVSTQHDEFISCENKSKEATVLAEKEMLKQIKKDITDIVIPLTKMQISEKEKMLFEGLDLTKDLLVNPTGKFVIGGPHGDTGLTGRKIIVDTYGGKGAHGGGAFSGKDPSKVDRSAAYAARHIAKNLVKHNVAEEILVQIAYAIGKAEPLSVYVNTYNTSSFSDQEISKKIQEIFPLKPKDIIETYGLKAPIFRQTATYGHMGRNPKKDKGSIYFKWEETTEYAEKIKQAFDK